MPLICVLKNTAAEKLVKSPTEKATGSTNVFVLSEPVEQDKQIYPYSLLEPFEQDERIYPYSPEDLIGKAFIREDMANGDLVRAEIIWQLKTQHNETGKRLQFLVETKDGEDCKTEHIMDYTEICDLVEAQMEAVDCGLDEGVWTFKSILAHQGPLTVKDPRYKGSAWNILIDWDAGEPTWEPLNLIAKSDPMSVSIYREKTGFSTKRVGNI
jgi:hypothetical protein